ncbi:uncharacterized protein RCC_08392 [Ramularia collo-cygni]|uniref:FAD dependent oxidoreductase domain-containing protein n=1 Tax=Ramularia collo-cygni TaxID=112498 RepID=A0A2D3UXE4_9PEZI|nr:uncharacterized protein RCC_08392 [Ramularia collo-cygni]CZT22687.1 uncharacterized protein RCC_08392 [Ramularia collo-cygni]
MARTPGTDQPRRGDSSSPSPLIRVEPAVFQPLPQISAKPGNRRTVVKDWRSIGEEDLSYRCEVCESWIEGSSIQCRQCKARICPECLNIGGKSSPRCRAMARDYEQKGCWCGIDGNFNMEFATTSSAEQINKRKRESVNPYEYNHEGFSNAKLGINARYSTAAMPEFLPFSQPLSKKFKLTKESATPYEHLDKTTTVVIGSGIVGLLITYQLATEAKLTDTDLRIIVLDINRKSCTLSSQQCVGLLSVDAMDERWAPLGHDFLRRWQELEVMRDPNTDLDAQQDPRINTQTTAAWLKERCQDLGVEFCFGIQAYGATEDRHGRISSVEIGMIGVGRPTESIPCSNLVVAAGPFTPQVYARLFLNSQLCLENNVQRVQKLQLEKVRMRGKGDNILATGMKAREYDGDMTIVINANEHTGDVYMTEKHDGNNVLGVADALKHNKGTALSLLQLAAKHVVSSQDGDGINESHLVDKSRSTVSTGTFGCPVIGAVPKGPKTPGDSAGVFLAYGFGMFGTTVAPIVGEIITALVCGKAASISLLDFQILTVPQVAKLNAQRKAAANKAAKVKAKADAKAKAQASRVAKKNGSKGEAKAHPAALLKPKDEKKGKEQVAVAANPRPLRNSKTMVSSVPKITELKKPALKEKQNAGQAAALKDGNRKGARRTPSSAAIKAKSTSKVAEQPSLPDSSKQKYTRNPRSGSTAEAAPAKQTTPKPTKAKARTTTEDTRPKVKIRIASSATSGSQAKKTVEPAEGKTKRKTRSSHPDATVDSKEIVSGPAPPRRKSRMPSNGPGAAEDEEAEKEEEEKGKEAIAGAQKGNGKGKQKGRK